MSRAQIQEGFRRIGVLVGTVAAIVIAVVLRATLGPSQLGGSWWAVVEWSAIAAPIAWWCGSRLARLVGWVIAGFFPDRRDEAPRNPVAAARAELLRQIVAKDGVSASLVTKAHWAISPYLTYLAWVLAWLAADWAGYEAFQLRWQGIGFLAPGVTLDDVPELISPYWLWTARVVAGIGTFALARGVFFVGSMVVHDVLFRKLSRAAPDKA